MAQDRDFQKKIIIGIDEAGRGPLAGPVYAAACVLPDSFPFEILADSKVLSEKKRLYADSVIKENAIAWSIALSTAEEIDEINILNASLLAMQRAFYKIQIKLLKKRIKAELALVDGNTAPSLPVCCKTIIKGDSKIYEIMAASILAKTARDTLMKLYALRWPEYNFDKNKGYPTKSHLDALKKFGPSLIHRKTFNNVCQRSASENLLPFETL